MKQVCLVLVVLLGLVLVTGQSAWAGILPGEYLDRPGSGPADGGDGGEDDDHPWGGDRVIGGGDQPDKYEEVTIITGYIPYDLIISRLVTLYQDITTAKPKQTIYRFSARPSGYTDGGYEGEVRR